MQGLCDRLTRGGSSPSYVYIYIYKQCSGMQGLYAQLTRGVHQNRDHFSKMIDLRGHMPRCTVRMNIFPSISLVTP